MSSTAAGKLWLRSLSFDLADQNGYCSREFIEQEYIQIYGTRPIKKYICPNEEEFVAFKELLGGNDKIIYFTTNLRSDAIYTYRFAKKNIIDMFS